MKKTKILFISTSLNMGGSEKYLATLVDRLRNDYECHAGYLKDKGFWGNYLEQSGIPLTHFRSPWDIASYLRNNGIDILHSFLYRANIQGRIAGCLAGTKVVISSQQAIDRWKPELLVMIDRLTSPLADAIMVNSRTAAESVLKREKFSAKKVRVVYNGIDHRAFTATDSREKVRSTLGIAHSAPVIISVARLHREKGSDFIPEIAENVRSAVFLMVGDGEERKPLERDLGQRGLLNRFLFTGWRSDIADLLKASDIFLLPSREESFPQAILEAMACSLPVVAAEIGGVKELVNDRTSGFLVKAGNVKGFSEALNHLIENPDEMRRMGNEGYRISLQFSENKMVQDMRGLYQEQLSRKAKV